MPDKRHKNADWQLPTDDNGSIGTWQAVSIAVLMDIRDELQKLNALLHCQNMRNIPRKLDRIARSVGTIRTTVKERKASGWCLGNPSH